jgi:hypothetical protein
MRFKTDWEYYKLEKEERDEQIKEFEQKLDSVKPFKISVLEVIKERIE